jgi:hypothetical protein
MAAKRGDQSDKPDRRRGDRRREDAPVDAERLEAGERRSGIERRLSSVAAADQIQGALGLLTYAMENAVLIDKDRWLLEAAITRLQSALEQLDEEASEGAG